MRPAPSSTRTAAPSAGAGTRPTAWRALAALATSATCHAVADRRAPLAILSRALGKERFWQLASGGMNGSYLQDQSWHQLTSVLIPALILAGGQRKESPRG